MGGTNFAESVNYLIPSFSISVSKILWIQFFPHSLDFNEFCMIQEYFSQSLETFKN